jgi:hypothetical protein
MCRARLQSSSQARPKGWARTGLGPGSVALKAQAQAWQVGICSRKYKVCILTVATFFFFSPLIPPPSIHPCGTHQIQQRAGMQGKLFYFIYIPPTTKAQAQAIIGLGSEFG